MDEIYNLGKKDVKEIYQLNYESEGTYFVLGYFKNLEDAEKQFEIVSSNLNKFIDWGDVLQIRKYKLEKLQPEQLDFELVKELEIEM